MNGPNRFKRQWLWPAGALLLSASLAVTAQAAQPPTYLPIIMLQYGLPNLGGCALFPADNEWNRDISQDALDPNSANYINYILNISATDTDQLHPDFGANWNGGPFGIPFSVVPANQAMVPINFTAYGNESDPGPYPVPLNAPVEAGSDAHVLVLQSGACKLYELYHAAQVGAGWDADSGAIFDLNSNALRTLGWTSADAAGLPILPGLARYDEVAAGSIRHALRVTFAQTQQKYVKPATHATTGYLSANAPPMGLRLRLKASYDISAATPQSRVILAALKRYGLIVADNGSNWYISGAPDARWDDNDLNFLKGVPGSAFEVVQIPPGAFCTWPGNVCN